MTESILLSLISTISSILFNSMFQESKELNIQGAPSWYGKYQDSKHIVAYGYTDSNRDFIKYSKDDCKKNMREEIETLLNKAISINQKNLDGEFNQLKTDYLNKQNLDYYFNKELNYDNIYHKYEENLTFSRCSIDKNKFLTYQKEIFNDFRKNYSFYKMDKRQSELEKEVNNL